MYKIYSGNAPICLQQLFKSNKEVHTHYTRQAQHLHSMKGKNEFVYRTFVFQSVVIWNKNSSHKKKRHLYLKYFANLFLLYLYYLYYTYVSTMCIYCDYCVYHYKSTELVSLYTLDIGL